MLVELERREAGHPVRVSQCVLVCGWDRRLAQSQTSNGGCAAASDTLKKHAARYSGREGVTNCAWRRSDIASNIRALSFATLVPTALSPSDASGGAQPASGLRTSDLKSHTLLQRCTVAV